MTATPPPNDPDRTRVEPGWHAELVDLYSELDREVARLGPICELSGRCCRFQEYGHTLFVSAPEVWFLLGRAPRPQRPLDRGESCPWQDEKGRCTARNGRPLGCRVYFCDPTYQHVGQEVSEKFIGRLKHLTQDHGLPWNYAPLHHHLKAERVRGDLPIDLAQALSDEIHEPRSGHRREAF
jgi:hypothetical protein